MLGEALALVEICALPEFSTPETMHPIADPARRQCSTSGSISNRKAASPDHMESRDREALNINKLELARIEKAGQLFRDLL